MTAAASGSYSAGSIVTRGTRAVLNPLVGKLTADRSYRLEDTIFVAGWARSGTTWLAEVLSTIPRSAILFEPLHDRVPAAAAAGFPVKNAILAPGEGTAEQKRFMERVLRGQVLNWWTCSANPVRRAVRPKLWIVKEIHANYLIDWILGTFPVRRSVLIVRHPCATIVSRMAQGWTTKDFNEGQLKLKHRAVRQKFPHLDALCRNLKDPYQVLAARWCLMNYVPLSINPRPFHVIAYESLATRGVSDLIPMFADWGIEVPPAMQASLGRASATTKAAVLQGAGHQQSVGRWRKSLTDDQTERILRVVRDFGMDFYTGAPEPDYDRLNRVLPR
jgi:hypothetical protein